MKRLTALVNSLAIKSDAPPEEATKDRRRGGNQKNRNSYFQKIARKLGSPTLTTSAWNWRRNPTRGFLAEIVALHRMK